MCGVVLEEIECVEVRREVRWSRKLTSVYFDGEDVSEDRDGGLADVLLLPCWLGESGVHLFMFSSYTSYQDPSSPAPASFSNP